jgi:polyhydroxyalkanoate synthesis repressor PhaR
VIKRYGNRRLYDAQRSRCVTLGEIAELVRERQDVRVVDGDTGEDLTQRTLLQIMLEQQSAASLRLIPVELLQQLIALRSQPVASWVEQYLQAGADFLARQGQAAGPAVRGMADSLGGLFPWLNPQGWPPSAGPTGPAERAERHRSADATLRDELADLQRRFAELSARLGRT